MRISLDTLRRDVQSRLVSFFRATVIEGDVDALKTFGALSFGLPDVGLAVTAGQFDVVGERCQQGTRVEVIGATTLPSAHSSSVVAIRYRNASNPRTTANTLLVALADLTTCTT